MDHPTVITCLRCGKCCLTDLIAYVTDEDRKRWTREGRNDILHILGKEHGAWAGDRLVSQDDGHPLQGCPFFVWVGNLGACTIQETKPGVCRDYMPGSSEFCPHFKGRRC
jgi:Fe-S-cluster containining protein